MLVDTTIPINPTPEFFHNVGNLFEVVAFVQQQQTGVFDAVICRDSAKALAHAGYSLKPSSMEIIVNESDLFEILITVEQKWNGSFRAATARVIVKALIEAGCSM